MHPAPLPVAATLALACSLAFAAAAPASAQDATRSFPGTAATQPAACAAAERALDAWLEQGKAEGRRRSVAQRGACNCRPSAAGVDCRIQARVGEAAFEAEEEDR